jgi:hypothetical protein
VLVQPLVESVTLADGEAAQALLRSFAGAPRRARIDLPGSRRARIAAYDATGRRTASATSHGSVEVTIPPGGFAVAERSG